MKPDKNQQFAINAAPDRWADYASEIKNTMKMLWSTNEREMLLTYSELDGIQKKSSISRTWLLLAGFALENLIKGLVIAENPEYISNGKLSRKVSNHDLVKLSESIKTIQLSKVEKDLLSILETCIPSWADTQYLKV